MARYEIKSLGAFTPAGISSDAIIVGKMRTDEGERGFALHNDLLRQLPPLPGHSNAYATGINELDRVVGCSWGNQGNVACYWDRFGAARALPGNVSRSTAFAINNAGTVIGRGEDGFNPVKWANGVFSKLPVPASSRPYYWTVRGINSRGEIIAIGSTYHWDEGGIAACWSPKGLPRLLRMPSGFNFANVKAINDAGVIVGWAGVRTGPRPAKKIVPCKWNSLSCELLPLPPEAVGGAATDINDQGMIVGSVEFASGWRAHAWAGSALVDLNTLVAPGSGWTLTHAAHVNNAGHFVGYGVRAGVKHDRAWHLYQDYSRAGEVTFPAPTWG